MMMIHPESKKREKSFKMDLFRGERTNYVPRPKLCGSREIGFVSNGYGLGDSNWSPYKRGSRDVNLIFIRYKRRRFCFASSVDEFDVPIFVSTVTTFTKKSWPNSDGDLYYGTWTLVCRCFRHCLPRKNKQKTMNTLQKHIPLSFLSSSTKGKTRRSSDQIQKQKPRSPIV